jgi:hypothetical protein
MKTYPRILRRDASQDHVHSLPDGKKTQGPLAKPTASNMMHPHTHLYEHEGKIHETGLADDSDPGHTHETIIGESSGPQKMPAKESFGPRNDEAFRIGREWVVRNDSGMIIARGETAAQAEERAKRLLGA